jgi:hypothetical protein
MLTVLILATATAGLATEGIHLQPRYDPAQVLDALGVPNGVIVISDTRKALLYGKSHMFVFRGGKFRELRTRAPGRVQADRFVDDEFRTVAGALRVNGRG